MNVNKNIIIEGVLDNQNFKNTTNEERLVSTVERRQVQIGRDQVSEGVSVTLSTVLNHYKQQSKWTFCLSDNIKYIWDVALALSVFAQSNALIGY